MTILPRDSGIPAEVLQEVLDAATFTVAAKRIVFCEGTPGGVDEGFYTAWIGDSETAVVPVGGCTNVLRCVQAYSTGNLTQGAEIHGIVDRDDKPRREIQRYEAQGIHVLGVHEVEGLLCLPDVFGALAAYVLPDATSERVDALWAEFETRARNSVTQLINKHALERAKRALEVGFIGHLNEIRSSQDFEILRENYSSKLGAAQRDHSTDLLESEKKRLDAALIGEWAQFAEVFPAKTFWRHAAEVLGIKPELYFKYVCCALADPHGEPKLEALGVSLTESLADHLPGRKLPS